MKKLLVKQSGSFQPQLSQGTLSPRQLAMLLQPAQQLQLQQLQMLEQVVIKKENHVWSAKPHMAVHYYCAPNFHNIFLIASLISNCHAMSVGLAYVVMVKSFPLVMGAPTQKSLFAPKQINIVYSMRSAPSTSDP